MSKKTFSVIIILVATILFLSNCSSTENIKENSGDLNSTLDNELKDVTEIDETSNKPEENNEEDKNNFILNPAIDRGNILTIGSQSLNGVFNPVLTNKKSDINATSLLFNGLVKRDKVGRYIEDLASWEISSDKLTYTFFLKKGVKFHNGEELTSEDILFTYYAIANPKNDGLSAISISDIVGVKEYSKGEKNTISGIKIVDEYTISFTISEAKVSKIADFTNGILNHKYYEYSEFEELRKKNQLPIGTGPMKFDEYINGQYIKYTSNKDYFGKRAKIDGVIIKTLPTNQLVSGINSGELDVASVSANLDNYKKMMESNIVKVQEALGHTYKYIGMNLRDRKFKDIRVRQALFYGLNLQKFIDTEWNGFAEVCLTPVPPSSLAYPDVEALTNYSYQPEKAVELLAKAGWSDRDGDGFIDKNGENFKIVWTTYNDSDWASNLVESAKNDWALLGIEVETKIMEFAAVCELVYEKQDFEVYNMAWSLSNDLDPSKIFGTDANSLGSNNSIGFQSRRANEIFRLAQTEYNQEKRAELYKEWAIIANEELPYIYISIDKDIQGVNHRVKNYLYDTYDDIYSQILNIELEY